MTTANETERNRKGLIFPDDEEARHYIRRILTDPNVEAFGDVLVTLLDALEEGRSDDVKGELRRLLEFTFQHSPAYSHALELYRLRFDIPPTHLTPADAIKSLLPVKGKEAK